MSIQRDRENCRWDKGIQPQHLGKKWHQTMRHIGIPKVASVSSSEDEDIQASPEVEKTKQKNMFTPAYTGELFSTIPPLGTQGQPVLPTVQYFTCQWPLKWQGWTKARKHSLNWNSSWWIQGRARGAQTLAMHRSSVKSLQIISTQSCDSLGRATLQ